jgi:hypothetical protein
VLAPRVKSGNNALRAIADGWSIAPIFQLFSGIAYDAEVSGSGGGAGSLNRSGRAQPSLGELIERNASRRRPEERQRIRLSRRFYTQEKMNIEALAEVFNCPTSVQVTGVNSTAYILNTTHLHAEL